MREDQRERDEELDWIGCGLEKKKEDEDENTTIVEEGKRVYKIECMTVCVQGDEKDGMMKSEKKVHS